MMESTSEFVERQYLAQFNDTLSKFTSQINEKLSNLTDELNRCIADLAILEKKIENSNI